MQQIALYGGTVRLYFDNKQRLYEDVYDIKYNDEAMTINLNNGMFVIVNMDKVACIETHPYTNKGGITNDK